MNHRFELFPERRRAKVAFLKKAVAEGTYKVEGEEIAEKLLKEWLFDLALILFNQENQKHKNN